MADKKVAALQPNLVIDREAVLTRVDGDVELLRELAATFERESADRKSVV
jgi:hypothetical protein